MPEEATDQQVLKALECKLPEQYGEMVQDAYNVAQEYGGGWREGIRTFLSWVMVGRATSSK